MTEECRIAYVNRVVSVTLNTLRGVLVCNGDVLLIICAAHMLKCSTAQDPVTDIRRQVHLKRKAAVGQQGSVVFSN